MPVFNTDGLPPLERFDYWRGVTRETFGSLDLFCEREADFQAELRTATVGPIELGSLTSTAHWVRRVPKAVRQHDPEMYKLMVTVRGQGAMAVQEGREAALQPTDLVIYDTSRPLEARPGVGAETTKILTALLPHSLVPLQGGRLRDLTATQMPGATGIGRILRGFLTDLTDDTIVRGAAESTYVAEALLDLTAALLTERAGALRMGVPRAARQALLSSIYSYIQKHLSESDLSPERIAAAHHISVRYLHKLFQDDGRTVSSWIREHRLDRCHRDLSDPALCWMSIGGIAVRWGIADPAYFSRMFRARYGVSPSDHRRSTQDIDWTGPAAGG